jgi:hypothetical protein
VLLLVAALSVGLVEFSQPFSESKLDLNNSGVWVTSDVRGVYARLNQTAGAIDTIMQDPVTASVVRLDVLQDQETVVGWQSATGHLFAIEPRDSTVIEGSDLLVDLASALALGGGKLAWVSGETGEVRVMSYTPNQPVTPGALKNDQFIVATLTGEPGAVAIAVDGRGQVFAASSSGSWALISKDGATQMGMTPALNEVTVTLVNGVGVVADPISGQVYTTSGASYNLSAEAPIALAQPSLDGDRVVVATTTGLTGLPLAGGEPYQLYALSGPTGYERYTPAPPVEISGDIYATWAGQPGRAIRIGRLEPIEVDLPKLVAPVLRVNYGSVILNDLTTGLLYDIAAQLLIEDLEARSLDDDDQSDIDYLPPPESPLEAVDDQYWVRPSVSSVLHVLDNDKNPMGGLLAIVRVSGADADKVSIAPDGQTLLINPGPYRSADMIFIYEIASQPSTTDGYVPGTTAQATVVVSMRPENANSAPREHKITLAATQDHYVASGATLSIYPLGNWRDDDCDSMVIVEARVGNRLLPVTAQSAIRYTAPVTPSKLVEEIEYTVADSYGAQVPAKVAVTVLATSDVRGVGPVANADVIRGIVNQPVTVYPLENDQPGADPMNRQAILTLASEVAGKDSLEVTTDLALGAVTITASKIGTYFLEYVAGFGSMFSTAVIRLDVYGEDGLLAMPDSIAVHGTIAGIVDVLANDHDPGGAVLTVVSAEPRDPDRVQAAVLRGRWVWVQARSALATAHPSVIDYVITDGKGNFVSGELTVTHLPAVVDDSVVVTDDQAIVRAGDVTLIPVLDNDTSLSGQALVIVDNVASMPNAGQLRVDDPSAPYATSTEDVGRAFVDGDYIRYEAPANIDTPRQFRIEYQAGVPGGTPMTGYVLVDVIPQPSETMRNRPPAPSTLEARVLVGGQVEITVPSYGQDPDGDSVWLVGLVTSPRFGRVVEISGKTMIYESYPSLESTGTDTFQFAVQDQYGAVGVGAVRIGVVLPSAITPPVAVPDYVTAIPGRPIALQPLVNDILPLGTSAVGVVLDGETPGVGLIPDEAGNPTNMIAAVAPIETATQAQSFSYHLWANGVDGPSAQVIIRSQDNYLNPPRIYDHVARSVGAGSVTVAVLDKAWDLDGLITELHVVSVGGNGTINCDQHPMTLLYDPAKCTVTIPVLPQAQVVSYVVEDGDGAQAMAVIFVPGSAVGRPYLRSDGLIKLSANNAQQIDLNKFIASPRGSQVHLTLASQVWTSPAANLAWSVDSDSLITLTSLNDYVGPAALTVEVRDSADATDVNALSGVVTIPVMVGKPDPKLICPTQSIDLVQGGRGRDLPIANLCSVWTTEDTRAEDLAFTGQWGVGGENFLPVRTGRSLSLQAASTAEPGAESILTIGIDGYTAAYAEVRVRVIAAPKPQLTIASVTEVKQGTTVQVTANLTSPLADPTPTIIGTPRQISGMPATVKATGMTISVTPGADSHGVMLFEVIASDLADTTRTDRQVVGSFSVAVYGRPDAPTPPRPATQLRSRSAVVSFFPGADNGGPLMGFRLEWLDDAGKSGSFDCGMNTTCEIPGLTNGVSYRFRVQSFNKAGDSPWSDYGQAVVPNALPGFTTGFACSVIGDREVTLVWGDTLGEGTAPTEYWLTGGSLNGVTSVNGSNRSLRVTGLDNNTEYQYTLVAQNGAGVGQQRSTVSCQSAGQPIWTSEIRVQAEDLGNSALIKVSWSAVDPNGPKPVTYQVTRIDDQGQKKVFQPTQATSLGDTGDEITYNGQVYYYVVEATNREGLSRSNQSAPWSAVSTPAPWSSVGGNAAVSIVATGDNGAVRVTVNRFPGWRDRDGYVTVKQGNVERARLTASNPSAIVSGVNGEDYTVSFQACNVTGSCNAAIQATLAGGPFGPLSPPTLSASQGTGRMVCVSASAAGNGRGATLVITRTGVATPIATIPIAATGTTPWNQCIDAGDWDILVNFSAQLTTDTTTPSRSNPSVVNTSVRSRVGVPENFDPAWITLVANGVSGGADLTITNFPISNGGTLKVTYQIGSGPEVVIGSPGSNPVKLTGMTNGVLTTVTLRAHNGTEGNTPYQITVTPYGPLSAPSLIASRDGAIHSGRGVCATATTPANQTNGAPARLIIWRQNPGQAREQIYDSGLRNAAINSGLVCVDAGDYSRTVTFYAQLQAASGQARGDSTEVSASVISHILPPAAWGWSATLAATTTSGQLRLTLPGWPARATSATFKIDGRTITMNPPGLSIDINDLTNGQSYSVTELKACAVDSDGVTLVCNSPYTGSLVATPRGPMTLTPAPPKGNGESWDKEICAAWVVDPGGSQVNLQISTAYTIWPPKSWSILASGTFQMCINGTGYSGYPIKFTAYLWDPLTGRASITDTQTITIPTDPATPLQLTASRGVAGTCIPGGYTGTCNAVTLTLSGFTGPIQCNLRHMVTATTYDTMTVYPPSNGTYNSVGSVPPLYFPSPYFEATCIETNSGRQVVASWP